MHQAELRKARKHREAALLSKMASAPRAAWFVGGTPKEVKRQVRRTVSAAASRRKIPVLVAYNLHYRDCAQYSAGGDTSGNGQGPLDASRYAHAPYNQPESKRGPETAPHWVAGDARAVGEGPRRVGRLV
jgi:hypothetical protein